MTQTVKKINAFEEFEKELRRTRIYPEPCPSEGCEVDFDRAKYIIDEREFHFVPRMCGCHADIAREENGIVYRFQPGTEEPRFKRAGGTDWHDL